MPRTVEHDERRRHIVEALLHLVGTEGLEAVSLREVAHRGAVDESLHGPLARAVAGFTGTLAALLGTCADPPFEARRLAGLLDGLRYALLLGSLTHDEAAAVVERHLGQLGVHSGASETSSPG